MGKRESVSLDDLDPFDLEGTPEDIDLVERGLAILARKQVVWASVVEGWKKRAGISTETKTIVPPLEASVGRSTSELETPLMRQTNDPVDGSVANLVHLYQTDERSPYKQLRFKTRETYDSLIRRILKDCPDQKLADLKARNVQHLYDDWTSGGKLSMAHSLVTMLRALVNFGAKILEDPECERLSVVLHNMRFTVEKPQNERLTFEQATAIRDIAHKMGRPSIALAQAFQFECALRQKEVIGEWVPPAEEGPSDIIHDGKKWLRGLRWEMIDSKLILRHVTSRSGRDIEIDLHLCPMVSAELSRLNGERPVSGPVIVCEFSGLPWTSYEFRRWWRKVADACGIPKHVKNMDSRPSNQQQRSDAQAGNFDRHSEPRRGVVGIDHVMQGTLSKVSH
jgi:hypothetical protein